jgi:acetyl esterase/lipase
MKKHTTRRPADRLVSLLLACLPCSSSLAQDYSQYYTTLHPQEFVENFTRDLYVKGNELTAQIRSQLPHQLDLPYGPDPKQRLDLYVPAGTVTRAPVLLFIHGGGFLEGDRAHYGYIARPYAPHGIITAVMSYRLTGSGAVYPAQEDDVKTAILWLHRHVATYGGDPTALYVTGHSAGAVLSAEVGVDRTWLTQAGIDARVLRGIAPVSGPYDLRNLQEMANYVPTARASIEASPILHIIDPVPSVVVSYGTNNAEEDSYSVSAREFVIALRKQGTHVDTVVLTGSGHIATAMALGTPGSSLSEAVLAMIAATARQGKKR